MYWLLIVGLIVVFVVWAEDRSQNCLDKPCQHSAPPVVEGDDPSRIVDKTAYGVSLRHTVVDWRRAVLAGLVVTLLLYLVMKPQAPTGSDFFVTALILILGYYLVASWFIWSWFNPYDRAIEKSLTHLRRLVEVASSRA